MGHAIFDILSKELPIEITKQLLDQLNKMVILFEIRDNHPMTLNSQLFGAHKFIFINSDRSIFFDIIGYDESHVIQVIKKIPSINMEFKVTSDALSIMIVYLAHLLLVSHLNEKDRHVTIINILNYMQYRLFSSAVNHYFRYGVSDDIMQSVIESLNMKFAIRQHESWKKVMTERSFTMAFGDKSHRDTLFKFNNDKLILYLISDTSTRIRSQIQVIASAYYDMKSTNTFLTSHSTTAKIDGEKIIKEINSGLSSVSSFIFDKMLVKQSFIDDKFIMMVQKTVTRLNTSILRRMLSSVCDEAKIQMVKGTTRKIDKKNDHELYIGVEELVERIVHVVYTTALQNKGVNIDNKMMIYNNTKNIFTAARTSNKELANVRLSFDHLCKRAHISSRESTISGLTIAFVLYVTLVSFNAI